MGEVEGEGKKGRGEGSPSAIRQRKPMRVRNSTGSASLTCRSWTHTAVLGACPFGSLRGYYHALSKDLFTFPARYLYAKHPPVMYELSLQETLPSGRLLPRWGEGSRGEASLEEGVVVAAEGAARVDKNARQVVD